MYNDEKELFLIVAELSNLQMNMYATFDRLNPNQSVLNFYIKKNLEAINKLKDLFKRNKILGDHFNKIIKNLEEEISYFEKFRQ